ncbi:mycothiol-dependent nitroreductase Rv2466c family protein [Geodermatophilus sp. SYSU D00079]
MTRDTDLHFWFDPVCPFAWLTSQWVRTVAARRAYTVQWRLISLRLLNRHVDYDAQFPPDYEAGHTAGLRLLRVAARARDERGPEVLDPLYAAMGARIFESDRVPDGAHRGRAEFVEPILTAAGLPTDLADALDDESWDAVVQADTDEALRLAGKDVGTPILQFRPPDGAAFFGPVISRVPDPEDAVALWDHVVALAAFPGFAEFKRSLRERPQLPAFGVRPGEVGVQEDWHGGSRRQHR